MPVDIPDSVLTLGEAIRHVREARGMSLRELARRIGVSAPFLSDIEHNRRSTDKLAELAGALEVPLDELARFDTRISPDVKEWVVSNPGMSSLLKEMMASGLNAHQLRAALTRSKKTNDTE